MNLSVGIVGLPNVGKSTLFNALLKKQVAQSANYPFTTIEPNVGVVEVPDERINKLKELVEKSEGLNPAFKLIPAVVKFVDIAGLVKGAAKGEGLGNKFLSHIREVDVIMFVVRDFKGADVVSTGSGDFKEDLEILKDELLLKDLETLDKRYDSLTSELRGKAKNDPGYQVLSAIEKARAIVAEGKWVADEFDEEGLLKIKELQLLSAKKAIVVINSDERDLAQGSTLEWQAMRISAKLEQELAELSSDEQKDYLKELGTGEPVLDRLIRRTYLMLGLITFFTAGPKEVRAWTTQKGALAPQAAGVIHSDFERGFIAADVIDWKDLVSAGSWHSAKTKGLVKMIGKGDEVKDGMVVEFKFSV